MRPCGDEKPINGHSPVHVSGYTEIPLPSLPAPPLPPIMVVFFVFCFFFLI